MEISENRVEIQNPDWRATVLQTHDIVLREAKARDLPGICALGMEALEENAYKGLVISRKRVYEIGAECVLSPKHFAWVVERDGEIVGAVLAHVEPMAFYERNQASVAQFVCKAPGYGVKLLRELLAWAKSRPAIKAVVFTLEYDMDPRIGKLLKRLGLTNELPIYMKVM